MESKTPKGASLDIVGFDACFMSMFEMAYELKGLAKYMVASQEEVPDASFPYDKLVELFRTYGNDTEVTSKTRCTMHISALTRITSSAGARELNPVTLSALRLDKCDDLKEAVDNLASALLAAPDDEDFRICSSRPARHSRDYAGGLYVDLYEFCSNLSKQLRQTEIRIRQRMENEYPGCMPECTGRAETLC